MAPALTEIKGGPIDDTYTMHAVSRTEDGESLEEIEVRDNQG